MIFKQVGKLLLALSFSIMASAFADTVQDPCGSPAAPSFLNIVDRPSVSDSACTVPFKHAVLETGYQYQELAHLKGQQQNFPQAEFRLGLPADNEFFAVLPNYVHQSITPSSGSNASSLGLKHKLGYTQYWLATVEGYYILPDGSAAFGSKGPGAVINGIITYSFNTQYSLTLMLGASSTTPASQSGGQRFSSINPDLVFTYAPSEKINFYGELYGQSKTGPGQGAGANFDGGLLYLLFPKVAVDLEAGQRICGSLDTFEHYIGAGLSLLI